MTKRTVANLVAGVVLASSGVVAGLANPAAAADDSGWNGTRIGTIGPREGLVLGIWDGSSLREEATSLVDDRGLMRLRDRLLEVPAPMPGSVGAPAETPWREAAGKVGRLRWSTRTGSRRCSAAARDRGWSGGGTFRPTRIFPPGPSRPVSSPSSARPCCCPAPAEKFPCIGRCPPAFPRDGSRRGFPTGDGSSCWRAGADRSPPAQARANPTMAISRRLMVTLPSLGTARIDAPPRRSRGERLPPARTGIAPGRRWGLGERRLITDRGRGGKISLPARAPPRRSGRPGDRR